MLAAALALALQATSVADAKLTPGVVRHDLTAAQIRATDWGHDERAVDAPMKAQVYRRYGFSGPQDPRCTRDAHGKTCEVDHRVPRCLGGADAIENLSPQPYGGDWNAHMKDRVEDKACRDFRKGALDLDAAQTIFLGDWTLAYRRWFGDPTHP